MNLGLAQLALKTHAFSACINNVVWLLPLCNSTLCITFQSNNLGYLALAGINTSASRIKKLVYIDKEYIYKVEFGGEAPWSSGER